MKIIASIEDPVVIGKILAHLEQATPVREGLRLQHRARRRTGGADKARAGIHGFTRSGCRPDRAWQGGLRPVGRVTAVTKRKRPANTGGRGPGAVRWWLGWWLGREGFRGSEASLTAGSRLDSHEIRGLCFLYTRLICCAPSNSKGSFTVSNVERRTRK